MAKKSPKTIQRSDADHSQIIGGGMQTIIKLLGGCSQVIGGFPPGFSTLDEMSQVSTQNKPLEEHCFLKLELFRHMKHLKTISEAQLFQF